MVPYKPVPHAKHHNPIRIFTHLANNFCYGVRGGKPSLSEVRSCYMVLVDSTPDNRQPDVDCTQHGTA